MHAQKQKHYEVIGEKNYHLTKQKLLSIFCMYLGVLEGCV